MAKQKSKTVRISNERLQSKKEKKQQSAAVKTLYLEPGKSYKIVLSSSSDDSPKED